MPGGLFIARVLIKCYLETTSSLGFIHLSIYLYLGQRISRHQHWELSARKCIKTDSREDIIIVRSTTIFLDAIVDAQCLSEHEAAYLLGRVKFAANNPAAVMIIDAELREGEAEPAKLEG